MMQAEAEKQAVCVHCLVVKSILKAVNVFG